MSRAGRLLSPVLAAVFVSLTAAAALAAPSPKEKAEARQLVTDAKKALKDKRFPDAVGALKKASQLDPSPATDLELAQAQIAAGKLVDASALLTTLGNSTDQAPAAKKARESAKKLLGDLKPRIPTVKVTVKGSVTAGSPAGGPLGKVTVTVDGRDTEGFSELSLDPGDHTIAAASEGFKPAEKQVKLAEGARESLDLTLEANAPVVKEEKSVSRLPGIIVTSVGGAALVVGGVFGGLAFSATSDAKATCTGTPSVCDRDKVDKAKLFGNVSTGMLIAGGAAAVAGVVLLIVAPGGGSSKSESPKGARVMPWVGADQVGIAGTF